MLPRAPVSCSRVANAAMLARCQSSATQPTTQDPFQQAVKAKSFHCTQCGKCCTGPGEVWVTYDECARLAAHLKTPLHKFLPAYTKSYSNKQGWRMLRSVGDDAKCIFLDADSNLCTVHEQRPLQCSTYPWWPDLMADEAWQGERSRICEGIEHEEAELCDSVSAGEQLRQATAHVSRRRSS